MTKKKKKSFQCRAPNFLYIKNKQIRLSACILKCQNNMNMHTSTNTNTIISLLLLLLPLISYSPYYNNIPQFDYYISSYQCNIYQFDYYSPFFVTNWQTYKDILIQIKKYNGVMQSSRTKCKTIISPWVHACTHIHECNKVQK